MRSKEYGWIESPLSDLAMSGNVSRWRTAALIMLDANNIFMLDAGA